MKRGDYFTAQIALLESIMTKHIIQCKNERILRADEEYEN